MRIFWLIFLLAIAHAVFAQTLMNRDSLLALLPAAKTDTNKVLLFINLGQQYENNEPETAKEYYRAARDLSKQLNYKLGEIKYITNYTYILNQQGFYDSSLMLNLRSVELSRQLKDSVYLAKTLANTGSSYLQIAEYDKSLGYYAEARRMFASFGDAYMEARMSDFLQLLYLNMHQYEKGIPLGVKAVQGLRMAADSVNLAMAMSNLGLNYTNTRQYAKAAALFNEALVICRNTGSKNEEATLYLNLSDLAMLTGNFEAVHDYCEAALLLSRELELRESELIAAKGLAFYYQYKKDYIRSKQYALEALAISYTYKLRVQRAKVFTHLSNLAYSMQDMPLGEKYALAASQLEDSLLNETIQDKTVELEQRYEAEKKAGRIRRLEAEKQVQQLAIKQKNIFNYILICGALVLLIIFALVYRTYKQRQRIQQQRIAELETEQQLTATEAVLKGEEQERTRLAKDLHDGLGGMLSGIKFSFANMKGNLVMTPDNQLAFERSMDMLDSSIREMRRVAHNMMPEALVKFGLDTALKDFCNDINATGALPVTYQSLDMEGVDVPQTTAITIYRVMQELVNNALKHAAANTILVQLSKAAGRLALTVEDDGKGFDTAQLAQAKGIGWSSIQTRIDYLKGTVDVQSSAGKGTSVHVEIPLDRLVA